MGRMSSDTPKTRRLRFLTRAAGMIRTARANERSVPWAPAPPASGLPPKVYSLKPVACSP
jgi:hypothetical protein